MLDFEEQKYFVKEGKKMAIRSKENANIELYHFEPETYKFDEKVLSAMAGGYDVHCHTAPDTKPRFVDEIELAHDMDFLGMTAAVSKMTNGSTCGRAQLANYYSGAKAQIFGSMCLCNAVGGLNPYAVKEAIKMGLKLLWMPVRDSAFDQKYMRAPEKQTNGLYILDPIDNLKPEIIEILKLLRDNKIAVATGHMSKKESIVFCKAARKMGVQVILTHPENICGTATFNEEYAFSIEEMKELASIGVYIEVLDAYSFHRLTPQGMVPDIINTMVPMENIVKNIRQIGCEHIVLGTDGGCVTDSYRCEYYSFIERLMDHGITKDEIQIMIRKNAEIIFGVSK